MSENTPTPAELVDELRNGGTEDRVELAEREARAADLIEQLTAVIEQAPHWFGCAAQFNTGPCRCWKSTAPATVLAQRDHDKWQEGYDERTANMERWHQPTSTERMYWPDSKNPYRIEREAQ